MIEGLIDTKMGHNDPHITALDAIAAGFYLRVQGPLKLGTTNKPESDLYRLHGTWRDYDGRRPDPLADVPLVVEVSDSILAEGRGRKVRLYAKHGLPEYLIVNLRDRTLEVWCGARPEFETFVYREGESDSANGNPVAVSDLLPKA